MRFGHQIFDKIKVGGIGVAFFDAPCLSLQGEIDFFFLILDLDGDDLVQGKVWQGSVQCEALAAGGGATARTELPHHADRDKAERHKDGNKLAIIHGLLGGG